MSSDVVANFFLKNRRVLNTVTKQKGSGHIHSQNSEETLVAEGSLVQKKVMLNTFQGVFNRSDLKRRT